MENEVKTIMGQNLRDMLEELYEYYFQKAREADRDTNHPGENNEIGKLDGACEVLNCIIFHLYGGKVAFCNWLNNIGEPDESIQEIIKKSFPNDETGGGYGK